MHRAFFALTLVAALGAPLAAFAQSGPNGGPPPEVRAKLDSLRAQAKTDAYAALSADHRTKVQALVAQVTAGTLDPRDAWHQIDALLSPDESTAVLAIAQKSREQMRAAFGDGSGPTGGPPSSGAAPSGAAPGGAPPAAPNAGPPGGPGGPGRHRSQSAGRFLLTVSMTPEQMRALRDHQSVPPPTKT